MSGYLPKLIALIGLLSYVSSEIIVDSKAMLALKKRSEISDFSLHWCDVFYQEDFPTNQVCSGVEDNEWDYFKSCCNGAYNCRDGSIWNVYLCPPGFVYDTKADGCIELREETCPYKNPGIGGDDMTTTVEDITTTTTTEAPVVTCGMVVNGKLPHPTDCTKYIVCLNKNSTVNNCYEGYIYYAPYAVCLPGDAATCQLYSIGK